MSQEIMYVGVDVDDKAFHGAVVTRSGEEVAEFSAKPNLKALIEKLEKLSPARSRFKICYEAGYLGFTLGRDLIKAGYFCEIVAPSLIPQVRGKVAKTDRLDSARLARFYSKSMLVPIHIPDSNEEEVRDLVRSRLYQRQKLTGLKNYLLGLCRRTGLHFKLETGSKSHWTKTHLEWLEKKVKEQRPIPQFNLSLLIEEYRHQKNLIQKYDKRILLLSSEDRYRKKVEALTCYRGVDTTAAMALISEIGDVTRFSHPHRLTSFAGLDIREYSSGGKEKKFGITKAGNSVIRTTSIESCQKALCKPSIGSDLKRRRREADPKFIKVADRCMSRLHRKGMRLQARGKHTNKVKVACAREMLSFFWESLKLAQAA